MSRGGRGGGRGRGGRRNGPDISWDDDPIENPSMEPEPLFPAIPQTTPKPLTSSELDRVNHYRRFRDLIRDGPLYTVLEPNNLTDEYGKVNKRAGFDPFEGVATYSNRYKKPKRTLPDLSTRPYVLKLFPKELWSTLDPKKKNPAWESLGPTLPDAPGAKGKRKRIELPIGEEDEEEEGDVVVAGPKKRPKKRDDPTNSKGQKKGLVAEDEYGPDVEEVEDDAGADEQVPEDSEFEESDDAQDDYNAEAYFEGGEDDDIDDDDGGEDAY